MFALNRVDKVTFEQKKYAYVPVFIKNFGYNSEQFEYATTSIIASNSSFKLVFLKQIIKLLQIIDYKSD